MAKMISVIFPSLNEQKNVDRALNTIAKQTYPHDSIEIIVADAHSTDQTRELIENWRAKNDISLKIVNNDRIVTEFGTAMALKEAKGDYIVIKGFDQEIVQEDAFEAFVKALEMFPDAAGAQRWVLKVPNDPPLSGYIVVAGWGDPLARELIKEPRLLEKREEDGRTYRRCRFSPAFPRLLFYRRSAIEKYMGHDTFEEGQIMLDMALSGNNILASVDGYGYRHHHVQTLKGFIKKRSKIAKKHTTRAAQKRTWVHYTGRRIYLYAFLHLTVVYPLLYSVARAVKEREPLWLLHAPMCFIGTGAYVVNWIRLKISGQKAW
jgi:glycosyltransferase involved in cell wall biosynthesis